MTTIPHYEISVTKLGLELETGAFKFGNHDVADPTELPNPKGKVLYVFRQKKAAGVTSFERIHELELPDVESNLRATAELAGEHNQVQLELIYGGLSGIPLERSANNVKTAASHIVEYMGRWMHRNDYQDICMQPGSNPGDTSNAHPTSPTNAGYHVVQHNVPYFAIHMTVGIPLAGFYHILTNRDYLKTFFDMTWNKMHVDPTETATLFEKWAKRVKEQGISIWKKKEHEEYGRRTALGFLCIVQSYVTVAQSPAKGDNRLKLDVPFMPRTDFRTMLRLVCDNMESEAATKFRHELPGFFTHASGTLAGACWSFGKNPTTGAPVVVKVTEFLADLNESFDKATLDEITLGDQKRNGQIGGLGKKVEKIFVPSQSAGAGGEHGNEFLGPILEFRDIKTMPLSDIYNDKGESKLVELEEKVKQIHEAAFNLTKTTH